MELKCHECDELATRECGSFLADYSLCDYHFEKMNQVTKKWWILYGIMLVIFFIVLIIGVIFMILN